MLYYNNKNQLQFACKSHQVQQEHYNYNNCYQYYYVVSELKEKEKERKNININNNSSINNNNVGFGEESSNESSSVDFASTLSSVQSAIAMSTIEIQREKNRGRLTLKNKELEEEVTRLKQELQRRNSLLSSTTTTNAIDTKYYLQNIKYIIFLQRFFRSQRSIRQKHLKERIYTSNEILSSEREYLQRLKLMMNLFYLPLKRSNSISDQLLDNVFGQIPALISLSEGILSIFSNNGNDNNMVNDDKDMLKLISSISTHIPFLKTYVGYVNIYEKNLKRVKQMRALNAEIFQLGEEDAQIKGLNFSSLMIVPVQRIPRYCLLLNHLLQFTGVGQKDTLRKVFDQMIDVANYINTKKKEYENDQIISNIVRSGIANLPSSLRGDENLLTSTRRLLLGCDRTFCRLFSYTAEKCDASVNTSHHTINTNEENIDVTKITNYLNSMKGKGKGKKGKEIQLFLFNDLLLCLERDVKSDESEYVFHLRNNNINDFKIEIINDNQFMLSFIVCKREQISGVENNDDQVKETIFHKMMMMDQIFKSNLHYYIGNHHITQRHQIILQTDTNDNAKIWIEELNRWIKHQ